MASAITLDGIDQAISNLKYKNTKTLKYKFVQHVRQYYAIENAIVSLSKIDHEELIITLWDTDPSAEAIKKKRKNLNSIRSSVNADLKKLFENGKNPEGIKIGPSNIFIMSEDAKDKILKKLGYELKPDGTLKLDQLVDILKVANETVSGSMEVEDTTTKDGLSKIDHLKDLIKGLSEKVGLGPSKLSKAAAGDDDMAGKGDDEASGAVEMAEVVDEELSDEIDEIDEVDELEEITDPEDEAEYIEEAVDEEEMVDDVEEAGIDENTDSVLDDIDEIPEMVEEIEDELDEEETDIEDVGDIEDIEEIIGSEVEEEQAGEFDRENKDTFEGIGSGQGSGQEKIGIDAVGDEVISKVDGTGHGTDEKKGAKGGGRDLPENVEHSYEDGKGLKENEQMGLPVGSLGQEYSIEVESKIKDNKILAEEFDGYLGSMDRYYNYYVLIQNGEYIIGSKNPKKDEKPEQKIYLESFYFGRFPITNGLFEIFVEKTGYKTIAEKVGYGTVYYGRFQKKKNSTTGLITSTWNASLYCKTVEGACWYRPSGPTSTLYNKRNHPVVQVSLEDAMAFAAWTGKRLPTENEWEAASRTANGWIFPWGQEWEKDACNIEDSDAADTMPVDKYVEFENEFGIVDTIGNVLEWTDSRYERMPKTNDGEAYRVVKGGSWISGQDIRLFSRFMKKPSSHSNILGFRCVAN